MDKKICYTEQNGNTVSFFNARGQYIWSVLGECISYTQDSATIIGSGRRDVYRFSANGTPNLIKSDNV